MYFLDPAMAEEFSGQLKKRYKTLLKHYIKRVNSLAFSVSNN